MLTSRFLAGIGWGMIERCVLSYPDRYSYATSIAPPDFVLGIVSVGRNLASDWPGVWPNTVHKSREINRDQNRCFNSLILLCFYFEKKKNILISKDSGLVVDLLFHLAVSSSTSAAV